MRQANKGTRNVPIQVIIGSTKYSNNNDIEAFEDTAIQKKSIEDTVEKRV